MSREFKFRCWIKEPRNQDKPYMAYFGLFESDDNYLLGITGGGEYATEDTVMQWTGLKDRKGKDVYEGDILRNKANDEYQIIWNEEKGGFMRLFPSRPGLDSMFLTLANKWSVTDDEVVGNVYEK